MVRDFFINACILIASVSLGNLVFRTPKIYSRKNKIIVGLMSGMLGIILMLFSVRVNETVRADFRNIAIILSTFYGGPIASIGTGLIIGLFRVAYFGKTLSSIVALINAIVLGIGCGLIPYLKIEKWKKWMLVTFLCLVGTSVSLSILIKDKVLLQNVLWQYWIGTGLMSSIMFYYSDRVITLICFIITLRRMPPLIF